MTRTPFVTLIKKEILVFCRGPSFIVSLLFFLLGTGLPLLFSMITGSESNTFRQFAVRIPFILIVTAPVLTMGIWSNEKREGTDLLLLSYPVSEGLLVLGKFFSRLLVYAAILLCTFPASFLADAGAGQVFTIYLFLLLYGGTVLALGQTVSFFFSGSVPSFLVTSAILYVFATIHTMPQTTLIPDKLHALLIELSFVWHFESAARGIFDTRDAAFYLVPAAALLYLNTAILQRRRYRP